jgi:hypothetical protein
MRLLWQYFFNHSSLDVEWNEDEEFVVFLSLGMVVPWEIKKQKSHEQYRDELVEELWKLLETSGF